MCTVSVVAWPGGLRLVANRDEQRCRPAAVPPFLVDYGEVRAIMPLDPVSRGTWIAVNEYGLVMALLNVNHPTLPRVGARSRGEIVARLAGRRSMEDVVECVRALELSHFAAFRLICAADGAAIELAPHAALARRYTLQSPIMFTSSGLGDDRVKGPRRTLFEGLMGQRDGTPSVDELTARQDAFHAHRWAGAPELSVLMARDDACTVSRTAIEVDATASVMTYCELPSGRRGTLRLPRR